MILQKQTVVFESLLMYGLWLLFQQASLRQKKRRTLNVIIGFASPWHSSRSKCRMEIRPRMYTQFPVQQFRMTFIQTSEMSGIRDFAWYIIREKKSYLCDYETVLSPVTRQASESRDMRCWICAAKMKLFGEHYVQENILLRLKTELQQSMNYW